MKAGSGIELEPQLGWVPVGMHWRVRLYGLESPGDLQRRREEQGSMEDLWVRREVVFMGRLVLHRCVIWFQGGKPGIIRTPVRSRLWSFPSSLGKVNPLHDPIALSACLYWSTKGIIVTVSLLDWELMEQTICLLFVTALVPGEEGRLRLRKSYSFIKKRADPSRSRVNA